jgi:hypothetical protein
MPNSLSFATPRQSANAEIGLMRRCYSILLAWAACLGCQNDTPGFDPFMRRHYVPPPGTGTVRAPGMATTPYYPSPVITPGVPASPPVMGAPPLMTLPPSAPPVMSPPATAPFSQPNYQNIQPPPFGVPALNSRASEPPWPRPESIAAAASPQPGPVVFPNQAADGGPAAQPASYATTTAPDTYGWRPAGSGSSRNTQSGVERSVLLR